MQPRRRRLQPRQNPSLEEGGEPATHVWEVIPSQHWCSRGYGRQRCVVCLAEVKGSGLLIKQRPCPGACVGLQRLIKEPMGHDLVAFDVCPGFVVGCRRCGCHLTGGAVKKGLSKPCGGFMTVATRRDWRRLVVKGLHPTCNVVVGPPIPVRPF